MKLRRQSKELRLNIRALRFLKTFRAIVLVRVWAHFNEPDPAKLASDIFQAQSEPDYWG